MARIRGHQASKVRKSRAVVTAADSCVIWSADLKAAMVREADSTYPYETGGILLGRRYPGLFHVTHVVGPGPDARHDRTSFIPDRDWQYEQIDVLYNQCSGYLEYLGDWHTHPQGTLSPSETDLALLEAIAATPESRCPTPIMCILAGTGNGTWSDTVIHHSAGRRQRSAEDDDQKLS
jgi:integrative and conjugative element protein (TIGR02256 family)